MKRVHRFQQHLVSCIRTNNLRFQFLSGKRCFSDKVAGPDRRKRFFLHVDVSVCPPIWETATLHGVDFQESPVSAGVDDSDSASGVVRGGGDSQSQFAMLRPRLPGAKESSASGRDWFCVRLDERPLKTPLGQPLAVPSEALAYALAAEWNCQVVDAINPTQMPLMTLVSTALDQTSQAPQVYQQNVLKFLNTDTVCYWADPVEERALHRRQESAWGDLHKWIEEWSGGHPPGVAMGHAESLIMAKQRQLPHPPQLQDACHQLVESLDAWHLTALHSMTMECKSIFVALSLLLDGGNMDVEAAMEAARVEEEFNISNWGLVEGQHDYDRLNGSIQLRAALLLKQSFAFDTI